MKAHNDWKALVHNGISNTLKDEKRVRVCFAIIKNFLQSFLLGICHILSSIEKSNGNTKNFFFSKFVQFFIGFINY